MSDPASASDESSDVLERGLKVARDELAQLELRRVELLTLIACTETVQRLQGSGDLVKRMTLHDAMALVLREHGNCLMNIRDLGNEVNQRDLYRKRDGSEVDINQFHARINNYPELFERSGPNVRLRA